MQYAISRRISPFTIKSVCTRRWIIRRQPRCIQEVRKLPLTKVSFVLIWCENGLDFWHHHKVVGLPLVGVKEGALHIPPRQHPNFDFHCCGSQLTFLTEEVRVAMLKSLPEG